MWTRTLPKSSSSGRFQNQQAPLSRLLPLAGEVALPPHRALPWVGSRPSGGLRCPLGVLLPLVSEVVGSYDLGHSLVAALVEQHTLTLT